MLVLLEIHLLTSTFFAVHRFILSSSSQICEFVCHCLLVTPLSSASDPWLFNLSHWMVRTFGDWCRMNHCAIWCPQLHHHHHPLAWKPNSSEAHLTEDSWNLRTKQTYILHMERFSIKYNKNKCFMNYSISPDTT